jgi:hypothetical protein
LPAFFVSFAAAIVMKRVGFLTGRNFKIHFEDRQSHSTKKRRAF